MAKKSAKRTSKKVEKVELTESYNKVVDTAKEVNTKVVSTAKAVNAKVLETATEVFEDVRENGKYWVENTTQKVKETITNFDAEKATKAGIKTAKSTVKNVNEFALETADELVDVALDNGKKFQGITAKAINGGLKIAAKQQDIVFDTLETVKGQLSKNAVRFRKLFKAN